MRKEMEAKMASTAERLRKLVSDNIELDGKSIDIPEDMDINLSEAGVPSTDLLALGKLIAQDFNVPLTPEDAATFNNLKKIVEYIDSKAA